MVNEEIHLADVEAQIMKMLSENEAVEAVVLSATDSFDDIGLDSIALIELSLQLESHYNTSMSGGEISRCKTIKEVGKEVVRRIGASYAR